MQMGKFSSWDLPELMGMTEKGKSEGRLRNRTSLLVSLFARLTSEHDLFTTNNKNPPYDDFY